VQEGSQVLAAGGIADPAREAETLLAHVLGVDRARLHADPEARVEAHAAARFRTLAARRAAREPLQYLVGAQEFWSLPFRVTTAVLIPRPETEHLIEALLALGLPEEPHLLDLGTGSGCLAVAAAHALPRARVVATDISAPALQVARVNAAQNGVAARLRFLEGDLFEPVLRRGLESAFDVILSNPPYIGAEELATLPPEIRDHEPRLALSPGPDPLAVHRRIALEAARYLRPGGRLIVEIGFGQEAALRRIYADSDLEIVALHPDLAGILRVLVAGARAA
jgi:release factor glutamine methyltransferase